MKRWIAGLLACTLLAGTAPARAAELFPRAREYDGRFADVAADAWYADAVADAYARGLMQGTAGGAFEPDAPVSAAEAVTLAARLHRAAHGVTGPLPASEPWYESAARYVADAGLLRPLSGLDADAFVAELQADEPCGRYIAGYLLSSALPDEALTAINEVDAIPDFLTNGGYEADYDNAVSAALLRLYRAGVATGSDEWGTFGGAPLTRAEAAALLSRIADPAQRVRFTPRAFPFTCTAFPGDAYRYGDSTDNLFHEGRLLYIENGKEGYVDARLKPVIPAQYDHAEDFSGGMAYVRNGNTCLLIDRDGKTLLRLEGYEDCEPYPAYGVVAASRAWDDWSLLSLDGKTRIAPNDFHGITVLSDKTALVRREETYALYSLTGEALTGFDYAVGYPYALQSGALQVFDLKTKQYKLLDEQGRETEAPAASDFFTTDLVYRKENGLVGVENRDGTPVLPCEYNAIEPVLPLELLYAERDGVWSCFDFTGKPMPDQLSAVDEASLEREGYAPRGKRGENVNVVYAYFDREGTQATPFLFEEASTFEDGAAVVRNGDFGLAVLRLKD